MDIILAVASWPGELFGIINLDCQNWVKPSITPKAILGRLKSTKPKNFGSMDPGCFTKVYRPAKLLLSALLKTWYKAIKKGSWTSNGRQEERGLILCSL